MSCCSENAGSISIFGLSSYIAADIDAVINRYTAAAASGEIRNPDNLIMSYFYQPEKLKDWQSLRRRPTAMEYAVAIRHSM